MSEHETCEFQLNVTPEEQAAWAWIFGLIDGIHDQPESKDKEIALTAAQFLRRIQEHSYSMHDIAHSLEVTRVDHTKAMLGIATKVHKEIRKEMLHRESDLRVVYMAHPVSGDVAGNIERAKRWMHWIEERFSGIAVSASWILECQIWNDDNPEHREAGIQRDLAVLERCDELWLVGPRISQGMAMERDHAEKIGLRIRDLTRLERVEPPGLTDDLPDA